MAQLTVAYAAACVLIAHVLQQRRAAKTSKASGASRESFNYDGAAPPATSPQPSQLPVVRHPRVRHDIMLRMAMARTMHECGRVPVWAMRQAGRYLPEFRALRGHTDFFTRVRTPALACELTLQPLLRFPTLLDAVVIFSDILIIPIAMGCAVQMIDGRGPVLPTPLMHGDDVDRLQLQPDAHAAFAYLYDAIALTRHTIRCMAGLESGPQAAVPALAGREVPIIGFVGGPFTLLSYMIEGGGTKDFNRTKTFLLKYPTAAHRLLAALADVAIECAAGQVAAGASILQVFESHAGELPPAMFSEFALPQLRRIGSALKRCTGGVVPLIVFPRAAHHSLEDMVDSDYDVIGLDWGYDPGDAVRRVVAASAACGRSRPPALQGNLDPAILFGSPAVIASRTKEMMRGFGDHPLIGNLGHGMLPSHDPDALRAYFAALHSTSAEMAVASGHV